MFHRFFPRFQSLMPSGFLNLRNFMTKNFFFLVSLLDSYILNLQYFKLEDESSKFKMLIQFSVNN
jgi:hypothetical protein